MSERIQKVLAAAGVDSRRNCEQLVLEGRVAVNGDVKRRLPILVDPETDEITVDGESVKIRRSGSGKHVYIMLNKPEGVYCTNVAQSVGGMPQKLAIDLLPPDFRKRVYPVGRLDASSRGLLLLTDDGELTHKLTHPSFGVPKTYRVVCDGRVQDDSLKELRQGIWLADREADDGRGRGFKTKPAHIKLVRAGRDRSLLEITLKEGRNRQIRRMLASLGHKVRDLRRVRFGPVKLEKLPEGSSRLLTSHEIRSLRDAIERGPRRKSKPKAEQSDA